MGTVNVATSCANAVAMPCESSNSFKTFFCCATVLYAAFVSMVKKEKECVVHSFKSSGQIR